MSDSSKHLIRSAELDPQEFSHPLNPNSAMRARFLSRAAGMLRLGVSEAVLPPGREAFVYHSHEGEEEFLYILRGRGVLDADGDSTEVGPGDFIGFPTPSVAHQLRNPFAEDLVYLMGGENHATEIADFPNQGKRLYRGPRSSEIVETRHIEPMIPESRPPSTPGTGNTDD